MEATANLQLPYIMPSQAQKHVTHNEALKRLDGLVQLAVLDRDLAAPPGSPDEGDRYIVAAAATGAWSGKDGAIAAFQDGGWSFLTPRPGWLAWVEDEAALLYRAGGGWIDILESITALQNLSLLGLGTTADATNPFSAKLNKALWTARYASESGDGDLRYTLNKEAAANTLSLLLQSNWSGRAEIGLAGDDTFRIKTSPDGSTWTTALTVDPATAKVDFPAGSTAVAKAGDTMSGALQVPAGDASTPGLAVGDADSGLFRPGSGAIGLTVDGAEAWRYSSGREIRGYTANVQIGSVSPTVQYHSTSTGGSSFSLTRWSNDASAPNIYVGKSRSATIGGNAALQANDVLGVVNFIGDTGTGFNGGGTSVQSKSTGDWSVSGTRNANIEFRTRLAGAVLFSLQITAAGELADGSGNVMIDANRIFRLRSYTVATVPSASPAGQLIYVSNGTSNKRLAVADGTNWRFPDGAIVS